MVVTALLFHQVALFEDVGLSRAHVPAALIYFAIAQVGATILTGAMIDAGALRASLSLSCAALTGAVPAMSLPVPDAVRVGTYGVALGYATGAAGVVNGALWPAYFGFAALGRIRALTSGIRNAATAGAPLLLALVAQWSDMAAGRLALGTVGIIALIIATGLPPPPRRPELANSSTQI